MLGGRGKRKGRGRMGVLDGGQGGGYNSAPSVGRGGGGIASRLSNALSNQKSAPFVKYLNDDNNDVSKLSAELGADTGDAIGQSLAIQFQDSEHKKLAAMLGHYTHGVLECENRQYISAHKKIRSAISALNQYLADCPDAWMVPMIGPIFSRARRVALACDGQREKCLDEIAQSFLQTLNRVGSDKSPFISSKRLGMVTVCNNISKIAFYSNNMGVAKSALQMLTRLQMTDKISILDVIPNGERVTHLFYNGRLQMLDQRFSEAETNLAEAFSLCPNSARYHNNKTRILVFLTTVKLVQGKYPTPSLLKKYRLTATFQEIITAMQTGDVSKFDNVMASFASFFAKLVCNVFFLFYLYTHINTNTNTNTGNICYLTSCSTGVLPNIGSQNSPRNANLKAW